MEIQKQPKTLRLAAQFEEEWLEDCDIDGVIAELRRLHDVELDYQRLMEKHNNLHMNAKAHRDRITALEKALIDLLDYPGDEVPEYLWRNARQTL